MNDLKLFLKRSLLRYAGATPRGLANQLRRGYELLETGRWLHSQSFSAPVSFDEREGLFNLMVADIRDKVVLYLEFGVFEGYSIAHWAKLLRNPASMLHGFDSFEGLPEQWKNNFPKGCFTLDGQIPVIPDPRVKLFKGWFDETLPKYEMPPHDALIINFDCDLYSSTKYVLNHFKDSLPVGSLLYFDEFGSWEHESRAFREFVEESGMRFELVGESAAMWSAAFRRAK